MLKVLYGPFQPALEEAFLGRLHQLRTKDSFAPIAVVAPSRRMADRLQRLAAQDRDLSVLGVHFHTFYSLAAGILEEAGFPDKKLIGDPLFHDRLIDCILSHNKHLGARFGGIARPKALASALRASIRDLIDAGVPPKDIREYVEDGSSRLVDLLDLQSAYVEWLEKKGIVSPSGLTAAAIAAAEESQFLGRFGEIFYYGFYDLTGLQLEFFERVTSAYPATLFFPYVTGHPAFRFSDELFELKLHRDGPPTALPKGLGETPAAPFFDSLFSAGSSPQERHLGQLPRERNIRVINASGGRDEVWRVAKEILSLVEKEGFDFDSIGVVARTLEPYRSAVAEIFSVHAIPHEMADGEPLVRHPLAKMCLTLLTLAQRDFPSHAVADMLHSPYFRLERISGKASAKRLRAAAPRCVERLQVAAGWPVWEAKLRRASQTSKLRSFGTSRTNEAPMFGVAQGPDEAGIVPEDARAMLDILRALGKDLMAPGTKGERTGENTWTHWSRRARKIVEDWLEPPKNSSEAETASWNAVLAALDALAAFDSLGPVAWNFFLDTAVEKIGASVLEAPQRRGVRVLNAMDARGESFRVLFLIGLQEGLFPRQVLEDPLLRDPVRAFLKHPAGYWISRKTSGHEEERLLFALNVMAARERLYCVYSRSDEDGKAKAPSIYLRELCRAAGIDLNADAEHVFRQPASKLSHCPPELLSLRESAMLSCLDGSSVPVSTRSLNAWGAAGAMDGVIGPPEKYLAKLARTGLSPTALERFSTCPFQFFAANVLRMGGAEEEPEPGSIPPKLRGEMYHAVLEHFYRGLHESGYWEKKSPQDWSHRLETNIESVFSQYTWKDLGVYPLVWKAARLNMDRHLKRFVAWDISRIEKTGLVPAFFEQELRGGLPLSSLPAKLEGMPLRGRADRIDVDSSGGRYRVIDYKTSWRRYGAKRLSNLIFAGRSYQLPVYAELAREILVRTPASSPPRKRGSSDSFDLDSRFRGNDVELEAACCYLLEDSEEETGRDCLQAYPGPQWSKDRTVVLEGISAILEAVSRGWFPIRPDDGEYGHCRFCSFASICRKSHGPSRLRAENEYEASSLKRIHDRSKRTP